MSETATIDRDAMFKSTEEIAAEIINEDPHTAGELAAWKMLQLELAEKNPQPEGEQEALDGMWTEEMGSMALALTFAPVDAYLKTAEPLQA
jgi:hypothetical protein